ncbi:hypothetical protein HYW76_03355 [Candidatus Pacearchaeota archaeon]|nr:hypothetical protein [Candidatus Pacearchaeota archaeon]
MKNKNVGLLVVGIAVIIGIIILIFNVGMKEIVNTSCSHGPECTMYDSIRVQTWISFSIAVLVMIIGVFLYFSQPEERVVIRQIKDRKKKISLEGLEQDEKQVIKLLEEENGAVFQSSLMEKLEIGKVKATRLLDKLEAKQLIERKRRGMNNIIVMKN